MSDTGFTLKIGDRSWVLADAEETAQAVPARVFAVLPGLPSRGSLRISPRLR